MADDAAPQSMLAPPAVTALRDEAAKEGQDRGQMLRTISMDIREEREDLKKAAEQSVNAILELDLDGKIRWVGPTWQDVTGKLGSEILHKDIAEVIVGGQNVFADCVEAMRKDDSKSRIVRFSLSRKPINDPDDGKSIEENTPVDAKPPPLSLPEPVQEIDFVSRQSADQPPKSDPQEQEGEDEEVIDLEAQGIMVYDRDTGQESYTMWMVKPAVSREITIDLPDLLVESLGIGAEMLANYLTELADVGVNEPESHPPPLPVLCRICERQITPWWFEKHTELCAQDHRAEMEVQMAQESLNEHRSALVKVLDALEAQSRGTSVTSGEGDPPAPVPKPEYKGYQIGPSSNPSSGTSSGRSSPAPHMHRSRDSSATGLSHRRHRSFAVRRPLARIVELVLDLCDTAMEISTPSIKDPKTCAPGEIRTQSPQSEGHIQQVVQWQSPGTSSLENEHGLALLCDDTSHLAKAKVEAVFRHRRILEYSERIRIEYEVLVAECIDAAVQKANRIKAGDLSDSGESEDSSQYDTPEQQAEPQDDTLKVPTDLSQANLETSAHSSPRLAAHPSAMAMALRSASELSLGRRASSVGSSGTSSPHGAATPKSHVGPVEPMFFHKRGSIAVESDAGAESDSSMHSSVASGAPRRVDSPSVEMSLSRVASTRSRERKRQSLVLPSLAAASSDRHPSPGRDPNQPSSPLRMAKPRLPSGAFSAIEPGQSPITSPVLSHSEFNSPIIRGQSRHHRRQSSAVLYDAFNRPGSPRLSGVVTSAQPRAAQTSIKDFEIIKPISKGAFGSVYLSKKKSTGDYYAIKVLKKADMIAKNQVTNVKAERAIMMWQGESDYVAKLYWTFSSKDYLYLVMEYLNGGDCASLIKVLGALPEDWTKKYMGEVVLCVQHLHSRQIIHRDLKPDNLLIDAKGHLKLTDFGLSRMGLIGRQQRAINAPPEDAPPDLLKNGPFKRAPSVTSSRSTSFDFQGASQSPAQTPSMHPAYGNDTSQPSYFNLNYRDSNSGSREASRRTSGHRSDSGDSDALSAAFRRISMAEGRTPIEEETQTEDGGDSPDPYALHTVPSNSSGPRLDTPPQSSMPPPTMALFDPEDSNRRFVGTPDYLAPETINGAGQDEMSDWWSLGCIIFECLYGRPPFNAATPEEVFQNIVDRNIQWPEDDEEELVSDDAKDLMNKLMCLDPKQRLGSNTEGIFANGGEEIMAHPWFVEINWQTLREDEASFVPVSENPEDTEYFDPRGASMENFAEFEDQASSPAPTPGADYPDRPHDALSRVRTQVNAVNRKLMPLHIPPHVRDGRSRRLSEPLVADDFGSFQFKNLPVLEKANKDVIQKLRADAMQAQSKSAAGPAPTSSAASASPAPSLEASPVMPMPLKRALSTSRGNHRAQSPSVQSQAESSPSRGSHPSSPLLVSFSAGQHHERRKTSSGWSNLSQQTSNPNALQPGSFFEQAPRLPMSYKVPSNAPSPVKGSRPGSSHMSMPSEKASAAEQRQGSGASPRQRSHTVGSQEGDLVPELMSTHHKRRSGVFDVSPSSSDTEDTRQKALLRVHRRRASSRRLSQVSLADGPTFRTLDVLVCEDHPVSRLVMERLLEKLRCRTIAVTNGSEALRYAMSEVQFDIIMMEYKLPHLNGADVARMIRDTKNPNSHTPIVAVTGYLKELQAPHFFDALVEKPPTKEKLEEVMGRLCQWRAAPEGYKPSLVKPIPQPSMRKDSLPREDSPTTTTTSSGFSGFGGALSSSRGDSIGSSQMSSIGDTESHYDSIPLIVSRQATGEWDDLDLERNFGGLGISGSITEEPRKDKNMDQPPPLVEQTSAPPELDSPHDPLWTKEPAREVVEHKSRSMDTLRADFGAEAGDDEDEELGLFRLRTRSPRRSIKRSSKLGTEMMRTNSQGSVVSGEDVPPTSFPENFLIQDAPSEPTPIAEEPAAELAAEGKITPPTIFPPLPGNQVEIVDLSDPDATPKPLHTREQQDPDPTPRPATTPLHPE